MKLLFVAAEGHRFSKTGGLGDVIGALSNPLEKWSWCARDPPYYDMVEAKFGDQIEDVLHLRPRLAGEVNMLVWNALYVIGHLLLYW